MLDRVISMKFIDSFVVHVYCSAMNKSGTGPIEHATFLRKEHWNNLLLLMTKLTGKTLVK